MKKVKVEVHVKKEHGQGYFSRKNTFLGGDYGWRGFKREGHQ